MTNQSFFMVYVENGNTPTYRHATLAGAEEEAKRLTELSGKKSWVLTTIKSIEIPEKFSIKDCRPDGDLPF